MFTNRRGRRNSGNTRKSHNKTRRTLKRGKSGGGTNIVSGKGAGKGMGMGKGAGKGMGQGMGQGMGKGAGKGMGMGKGAGKGMGKGGGGTNIVSRKSGGGCRGEGKSNTMWSDGIL